LIPMAAVISAAASTGVHVLLGDQWSQAAQLVPILAVASTLSLVAHLPAVIAEATGKLWQKAVIQCIQLAVLGACISLSVSLGGGIRGLAVAALVAQAFQHLLYIGWFGYLIKGSLRPVVSAHLEAVVIAFVVFICIEAVGHFLGDFAGPGLALTGQIVTAALTAIALMQFGGRVHGIQVIRQRSLFVPRINLWRRGK
jgi:O-antigen/teichoic acid export membrane protein